MATSLSINIIRGKEIEKIYFRPILYRRSVHRFERGCAYQTRSLQSHETSRTAEDFEKDRIHCLELNYNSFYGIHSTDLLEHFKMKERGFYMLLDSIIKKHRFETTVDGLFPKCRVPLLSPKKCSNVNVFDRNDLIWKTRVVRQLRVIPVYMLLDFFLEYYRVAKNPEFELLNVLEDLYKFLRKALKNLTPSDFSISDHLLQLKYNLKPVADAPASNSYLLARQMDIRIEIERLREEFTGKLKQLEKPRPESMHDSDDDEEEEEEEEPLKKRARHHM